jgi:undecaprenyl phosphate-alpha-L-ara4FN deformylase
LGRAPRPGEDVRLALRVEVATLRGTREAAPRLAALLQENRAGATFLFNLGPDRAGRAIATLPGASKLKIYGLRALLSGTLLPAPDIGVACRDAMLAVRSQGFEAGILAYDRADWARNAAGASEPWTREAMQRAWSRYEEIFGTPAATHGAPGWQMNRYAFRHAQRLGFRHCSDTRGSGPFIPVIQGEIAACPQLPTTLPTLDELLAGGLSPEEAVRRLLELSRNPPAEGHVCTLRAELEGAEFKPVLHALLAGWRDLGCSLVSLREYAAGLDLARLPRRVVVEQSVPGARGLLSAHGKEFLT